MTDGATGPAHVHVVRGAPDDVELAALVAGLAAVQSTGQVHEDPGTDAPRGAWTDRSRSVRAPATSPRPGPDAWRWSLRG